jgi:hypothetical protein
MDGATTLFAPLNPTGMPNTIGRSSAPALTVNKAVMATNIEVFCANVFI